MVLELFLSLLLFFLLAVSIYKFFTRDPIRIVSEPEAIVSPADGKVIKISEKDGFVNIVVFLRLWDVHVQRIPYSGTVSSIVYKDGPSTFAFMDNASSNKQVITRLETGIGPVWVKQITGFTTRRIRNLLKEGEKVNAGDKLGSILLGSRVELILPEKHAKIIIKKGSLVKGAITVLARPC